jgi:small subunit ribosomal protein S1
MEGLIHISELSEQRVTHPKEVVREGDVVTLRVIKIDPERRRIGLSLRKVDSAAYADFDWKMALAEEVGKVGEEDTAEAVVEDLAEETPAEETLAEEPLAEETLAEEAPAEETPAEEPLAEETLAEETLLEEPLTEETPAEEPLAEETPAVEDDTPEEEPPAEA